MFQVNQTRRSKKQNASSHQIADKKDSTGAYLEGSAMLEPQAIDLAQALFIAVRKEVPSIEQ